jgi:ribosomal protein S10
MLNNHDSSVIGLENWKGLNNVRVEQINKKAKPSKRIILKTKHKSMAALRSPHVDKRGLDQFDYVRYRVV